MALLARGQEMVRLALLPPSAAAVKDTSRTVPGFLDAAAAGWTPASTRAPTRAITAVVLRRRECGAVAREVNPRRTGRGMEDTLQVGKWPEHADQISE